MNYLSRFENDKQASSNYETKA